MINLNFDKGGGLLPAVVQDAGTGEILMLAYMNEASWNRTLETGKAVFWSRSRRSLWMKGEQSGHFQVIREIRIDCDEDAILLKVEQVGGAACHTGYRSCFYRKVSGGTLETDGTKVFKSEDVYR